MSTCKACEGSGKFVQIIKKTKACPRCEGSGKFKTGVCFKCKGEKMLAKEIHLPAKDCLRCKGTGELKPKPVYKHKGRPTTPGETFKQPTLADSWPTSSE
jgi:RecJ-like exonuclease